MYSRLRWIRVISSEKSSGDSGVGCGNWGRNCTLESHGSFRRQHIPSLTLESGSTLGKKCQSIASLKELITKGFGLSLTVAPRSDPRRLVKSLGQRIDSDIASGTRVRGQAWSGVIGS
ncbi:hypothetical protein Bca4012_039253 [Brassica carinata]